MDWRKFFDLETDDKDKKKSEKKFNFKKFDEDEEDDDFFDLETFFNEFHDSRFQFHGFPKSMLQQFKDFLKEMKDIDEENGDQKERSIKKFHDNYSDFKQKTDKDLDGKIYADQLDVLLKRINPTLMLKDDNEANKQQLSNIIRKLTDEEKIMDIIHGTYKEAVVPVKPRKRHVHKAPISPHHFSALPPFNEFPAPPSHSPSSGSRSSWGRTVISIRNSDGSYETRKIEKMPDGNTRTTITKKDVEGNSSTQSFTGDEPKKIPSNSDESFKAATDHNERNLINYNGYKIPCLW